MDSYRSPCPRRGWVAAAWAKTAEWVRRCLTRHDPFFEELKADVIVFHRVDGEFAIVARVIDRRRDLGTSFFAD